MNYKRITMSNRSRSKKRRNTKRKSKKRTMKGGSTKFNLWYKQIPTFDLFTGTYYTITDYDVFYSHSYPRYRSEYLTNCYFFDCLYDLYNNGLKTYEIEPFYMYLIKKYDSDNNNSNNNTTESVVKCLVKDIKELYSMKKAGNEKRYKDKVRVLLEKYLRHATERKEAMGKAISSKVEELSKGSTNDRDFSKYLKRVADDLQTDPNLDEIIAKFERIVNQE